MFFFFCILIRIFCTLFVCFVLDGLSQSIYIRMFCSKNSITFENMYILNYQFHCLDIFYIKFRFCKPFTITNFLTKILLIEALYKFTTTQCWFTLYLHMYVLGQCRFKCFVYLAQLSCVSHSIEIYSVAIKNIRNITVFQPIKLQVFCILTVKPHNIHSDTINCIGGSKATTDEFFY